MIQNDNSNKGAEQQQPDQNSNKEQTPQRQEQEAGTEPTTQRPAQEENQQQDKQRPGQEGNKGTAFTPSTTTIKADAQRQAQQKREEGLVPETKDIDNIN